MIEQDVTSYTHGHMYDSEVDISAQIQIERMQYYLGTTFEKNILELGIGNGRMVEKLEESFQKVSIIEGSSELILDFKQKHKVSKAVIINTYFENFSTAEQFDVVHMGFVLEHVKEPQKLIKQYYDYVKKNGFMFISVPNAESLHRRIGFEAGLLKDVHSLSETDHRVGHLRYYDIKTLKKDILNCLPACAVLKFEGLFLKPLTTKQLENLSLSKEIIDAFCKVGIAYPELSNSLLAIIIKKERD